MRWMRASALVFCSLVAMAAEPAKGGKVFVSSFMTMHDPFFEELNAGFNEAVEDHGDRLLFLDGNHSREKQEKDIVEALKQNPSAIFLVPATDLGSIDGILAAATAKRVPVIIVDTDIRSKDPIVLCQVMSDNRQAGRLSCDELAKVNPKAKVGILGFSLSKGCVDRVDGFKEALAKHPEMRILDIQDGHANKEGVRGVIKDFLARHPEMDAIFAINDVSALEALAGIDAVGRTGKITVLGVAGSREGAQAIQAGRLHSSCAQRPREIGRVAVERAYDRLAGKDVPKDVLVPVVLVTEANASTFAKP